MTLFIITWSLWLFSEILLNVLYRSTINDKKGQDKGSVSIIWITICFAISLGVIFSICFYIPISNLAIIQYFGLFLIIAGMIIRFISIWSLGRLFTVVVTIRDNHKIKKDGMYILIRHPSYSGSLVSFLGLGF